MSWPEVFAILVPMIGFMGWVYNRIEKKMEGQEKRMEGQFRILREELKEIRTDIKSIDQRLTRLDRRFSDFSILENCTV